MPEVMPRMFAGTEHIGAHGRDSEEAQRLWPVGPALLQDSEARMAYVRMPQAKL